MNMSITLKELKDFLEIIKKQNYYTESLFDEKVWQLSYNLAFNSTPITFPSHVVEQLLFGLFSYYGEEAIKQISEDATDNKNVYEYIKSIIEDSIKDYPVTKWEYKEIMLKFSDFEDMTRNELIKRTTELEMLAVNPEQSEISASDIERHVYIRKLIEKDKRIVEPIICLIDEKGKYSLEEGWHRIQQGLDFAPEGIYANMWIGYI